MLFDKNQTSLKIYPLRKYGGYIIPNGVVTIGEMAFANCTGLTSVDLGETVASIGNLAFSGCSGLDSIIIPNSVTNLGYAAFRQCWWLRTVQLGNGINTVPWGAFEDCERLTSINIPDGVSTIESNAFDGCLSLTHIGFPKGLRSIEERAFMHSGLTNITMPSSVSLIGDMVFWDCWRLQSIYFEGNRPTSYSDTFTYTAATIYYLPGTTGWTTTYGGRPTARWVLPNPRILTLSPYFGVQFNQFRFRVSWATNIPVVVEACTNLSTPVWTPLKTNTLVPSGWFQFSDLDWTNHPSRLYRVRSQ